MKRRFTTAFILGLFLLFISVCIVRKIQANPDISAWFTAGNPEFAIRSASITANDIPPTYASRGNISCDNLSFTKRNGDLIPFSPIHTESIVNGCFIGTPIGLVASNGFVQVSGTNYVAETIKSDGQPTSFSAFPNTDIFISSATSAPVGVYVSFDHLRSSVAFSNPSNGKIQAILNPNNQRQLTDNSGSLLPVMADNFGISENGQWAVVDSPGRGVMRINLQTLEALPFTQSFERDGLGAVLRYAISSDGRYVALASKNYDYFRLFDLSTCSPIENHITSPANCQSRDLQPFIKTKIPTLGTILQMRFVTNNLLRLYASYGDIATPQFGQYVVAAPGTSLSGMDYLALGDSFSSGEGAQKYEIGTDEKNINMCHLSNVSFPYLIALKMQLNSFHSVACSGAKTYNLQGGSGLDPTVSKYDRDNQYIKRPQQYSLGSWLPGYEKQIDFISENAPQLITLSAIGNDLGFKEILQACVKPGTCYPSYEDRIELFNEADTKLPVLVNMYQKIKAAAPPNAKIFAVGYPQLANSLGSCGLNVHMNQSELTLAGTFITRINQIVKTAAMQAGVNYAEIETALNGYRLCEGTYGNMAVNGLTAGKDIYNILGNESYHPNEFGQFLMAQAILGSINSSANNTPSPSNAALPKLDIENPGLKNAPKSGRTLNRLQQVDPSILGISNGQLVGQLDTFNYGLLPRANYTIQIDSVPSGTVTPNGTSSLSIDIAIAPGSHSVNITGLDATGQITVLHATIGNIIPTTDSPCGSIAISSIDYDSDGMDDACDSAITNAPTVTPSNPNPPITPSSSTAQVEVATVAVSTEPKNNPDSISDTPVASNIKVGQVLGENSTKTEVDSALSSGLATTNLRSSDAKNEASTHPLHVLTVLLTLLIIFLLFFIRRYLRQQKHYNYSRL